MRTWLPANGLLGPDVWLRCPSDQARERWLIGSGSNPYRYNLAITNEVESGQATTIPAYGSGLWCDHAMGTLTIRQDTIAHPNPAGHLAWFWSDLQAMAAEWGEGGPPQSLTLDGPVWFDATLASQLEGPDHIEAHLAVMAAGAGHEWHWSGYLAVQGEYDEDPRPLYAWLPPEDGPSPYPYPWAQLDLRTLGYRANGHLRGLDVAALTRQLVDDNPTRMPAPTTGWEDVYLVAAHLGLESRGSARGYLSVSDWHVYTGEPEPPPPETVTSRATRLHYSLAAGRFTLNLYAGRRPVTVQWADHQPITVPPARGWYNVSLEIPAASAAVLQIAGAEWAQLFDLDRGGLTLTPMVSMV